jgi:hypothetical protein
MIKEEISGFFRRAWQVMRRPKGFFDEMAEETSIRPVLVYFIILNVIVMPFGIAWTFLDRNERFYYPIIGQLMGIIALLLVFLFYHLFIRMFGGKQGRLRTYQSLLYGFTPMVMVMWFPVIKYIGGAYAIYILTIGLAKLQKMKVSRVIAAYLTASLALLVLAGIPAFIIGYFLVSISVPA